VIVELAGKLDLGLLRAELLLHVAALAAIAWTPDQSLSPPRRALFERTCDVGLTLLQATVVGGRESVARRAALGAGYRSPYTVSAFATARAVAPRRARWSASAFTTSSVTIAS